MYEIPFSYWLGRFGTPKIILNKSQPEYCGYADWRKSDSEKQGWEARGRRGRHSEPLGDCRNVRSNWEATTRKAISHLCCNEFFLMPKGRYYSWRRALSFLPLPFDLDFSEPKYSGVLMVSFKDGRGPYVSEHNLSQPARGFVWLSSLFGMDDIFIASPTAVLMLLSRTGLINSL